MQFINFITLILNSRQQGIQFLIVYIHWIKRLYPFDEITQNIHIVGESIIRRFINTPIQTYTTIFRSHKAEVITCLQIIPILLDTTVIRQMDTFSNAI